MRAFETKCRRLKITLAAIALAPASAGSVQARPIEEAVVRQIAEEAAGCSPTRPCQTRLRMIEGGRWSVIVSYVSGYRANGEPILTPGAWVGFTIDEDGKILDRMPGA